MIDENDCFCTDEVVCPHCGYMHDTSYEFFSYYDEDVEIECYECGKPFMASRNVEVSYTTRIIKDNKG